MVESDMCVLTRTVDCVSSVIKAAAGVWTLARVSNGPSVKQLVVWFCCGADWIAEPLWITGRARATEPVDYFSICFSTLDP